MSRERNSDWDVLKPYPTQLTALRLAAEGHSLQEIGKRMGGRPPAAVGALLSGAYSRLKITRGLSKPGVSQERRWKAVKICKDQGWLPEDTPDRPVIRTPLRAKR
jgi:hypothetical protein